MTGRFPSLLPIHDIMMLALHAAASVMYGLTADTINVPHALNGHPIIRKDDVLAIVLTIADHLPHPPFHLTLHRCLRLYPYLIALGVLVLYAAEPLTFIAQPLVAVPVLSCTMTTMT